ncbi:MAG: L-aspartate oxidase [Candidatus Dadabacteria bacterium]|nr:MAG: L-aspartate oxidase [Candidatus Dadabacteria bacterium]
MPDSNYFDFLVIGGGIAGLTYALEVADYGSVAVLFKKGLSDSSTAWAQGGIAAVSAEDDSIELHLEDTLRAGAGLCNPEIVKIVVNEGPARVRELIGRGAHFDKDGANYHLNMEGGHSRRRIFHNADATGYEIQNTLLKRAGEHSSITFFPYANAVDLITTHKLGVDRENKNRAVGAYILFQDGCIKAVLAKHIMVATGGAGKVYLYTSNPDVATGDGIAMCFRAGARVANMEFFQFHPTCLYDPRAKNFLITEAMRGEGAVLRRQDGTAFMKKYHPDGELAPRDVVARAIDHEMKATGDEYVLLDITSRSADFIKGHFPTIYERCLKLGYDITREPVPVVPAAHYCCGGVLSDKNGCTDIERLYVAGECACTGLHGANRLASNSLLEGLVFAYRAAKHSLNTQGLNSSFSVPDWDPGSARDSDEEVVITQNWDEIRRFMFNYVGIVRTNKRLERALHRAELIEREINEYYWNFTVTSDLLELRNLSLVARLIIKSAICRKESRGLHYNLDYPEARDDQRGNTVLTPVRNHEKIEIAAAIE